MEEHTSHRPLPQNPIQLTPAQYERLFFQPGGGPRRGDLSNPKQFGNPTAFAIISYLLALTPTVCILMSWDGTAPTSLTSIIGDFYFIGGLGMTIGGVFEWALGNTFPFVVFSTFGGFWLSLGVLFDPSKGIASAFPDGTDSPAFNHGVQFYFTFWAILCALYLIAAVRTNVVFMYVFLTLVLTFAFLAAAYRQSGLGNANMSLTFLKTAGAFGFANIVGGWYLAVVLVFAAVDMPFDLPVGDLSRFLNKRKTD
ncbi:GPR1/FUN34/yaaH family-domain-containing protein [Mycena albidolilacea]|uniref:GPR1/FUN34/yaaH family-domain-containing protein n=1 Tax=Mycena albidolilacea TaxID=1033008 RepID=A0AAD7AW50_9AGAR|nr:GPR1/FUN34/yaaH family-domain-containing protein [Mycena albidolilacea]